MPKNKLIVVLGVVIALQPFLGFPNLWESYFQIVAGALIVLLSIWSSIDKRLTLKARAQRRQIHKRRTREIVEESQIPVRLDVSDRSDSEAEKQLTQEENL